MFQTGYQENEEQRGQFLKSLMQVTGQHHRELLAEARIASNLGRLQLSGVPSVPELLALFTIYISLSATNETHCSTKNITCDSVLICSQSFFYDYGSVLEGTKGNVMKA